MERTYALTVFDQSGGKLLDESFTAKNDDEAKEIGQTRLEEEEYSERTHRCVSPEAKLILFHR
ncbi:YhzD family protein [Virgibacillus oceani]